MSKKIQKPFSIEEWKKGARVETRGGQPARVLCTDRKADDHLSIVGLITYQPGYESITRWHSNGCYWSDSSESNRDLVIVEGADLERSAFLHSRISRRTASTTWHVPN